MNLKELQNIPNTGFGRFFNFIRYLGGRAPLCFYLVFMITYRCNLNCPWCNIKDLMRGKTKEVSIEDAKRIERNISKSMFKPKIHLFGGEPTVHSSFEDIVELFDEKGYKLSMTSNGIETSKFKETIAGARNFEEVNISVNIEDYSKIRDTSKSVVDERNRRGKKKPKVNVNCPVTPSSHEKLSEIVGTFKGSGIDSLSFQHLIFGKEDMGLAEKIDLKVLKEEMDKIKQLESDFQVVFFPNIKKKDLRRYYRDKSFPGNTKCLAPWFRIEVLPSGDVPMCLELLADDKASIVGNLKEQSLKEIWNGKKARTFRKKIHKKGVLDDSYCFRCCHRQYY